MKEGGPMAGGGGAARPLPTETSLFGKTGAADAICGSAGRILAVSGFDGAVSPANAHGACSTDLPFDGSSLCNLPLLSIQTVWVSMPVQMVSAKPRSVDGIQPDGTMTRTAIASTISAAAKFLNGEHARITRALCARLFVSARA